MLQIDFLKFCEGTQALEKCKNEYASLLGRLNEAIEQLRKLEGEEPSEELEAVRGKLERANSLHHSLTLLTNAAGLSLYQYQLAGKLTAYRCESIFISPVKGRRMREIALTHLKKEMSEIQFGKESD